MNAKYHIACGIGLDILFGTKGMMTLFSVLPDTPLLFNEIKLRIRKESFNEWKVSLLTMLLYRTTHSLFFLPFVYVVDDKAWIAWLIHQITDWFTHTGRFASEPIFPFGYRIKFGRNILK